MPELQYYLMKDQLNKTISDASNHVPTKNEELIKADDIISCGLILVTVFLFVIGT